MTTTISLIIMAHALGFELHLMGDVCVWWWFKFLLLWTVDKDKSGQLKN